MTQTSGIPVVSARTSNNPYATSRLWCTVVRTREHAQLAGVLSFGLFICLTIVSFMMYQVGSLFYIIGGIIVYAFLAESLFRTPRPCGILAYLIFETLQIGFYIAAIMFSIIFVLMGRPEVDDYSDDYNTTSSNQNTDPFYQSGPAVIIVIVGCLVLLVLKTYFVKVFTRFYRFVTYQVRHANDLRAQYVHGRGVNLGFPSAAYDASVIHDPGYGYSFPIPTSLPTLPTYGQAMTTEKPPPPSEPTTETIDTTTMENNLQRSNDIEAHRYVVNLEDPFTNTRIIPTPPYTSSVPPMHQNPPPFSP